MLFAFRSADARKFPQILQIQTWAGFPRDARALAQMVERGLAKLNPGTQEIDLFEFEKPRVHLQGSASAWPDIIGDPCFTKEPFIISDRVASALQDSKITGFAVKPVEIVKKRTRRLDVAQAPRYFLLEARSRIQKRVPTYKPIEQREPVQEEELTSGWDGSDIFAEETPGPGLGLWAYYCTQRVYELVREQKWTNFAFQPLRYFKPHCKIYLAHESNDALPMLIERYLTRIQPPGEGAKLER